MTQFHDLKLVDVSPEGRDGVCLSFQVPDARKPDFDFVPGQYVTLRATIGGEDLRRPYSICSAPGGAVLQVGERLVTALKQPLLLKTKRGLSISMLTKFM